MDSDQAATVFVEVCTRLDELVETQRKTNELLAGLESALRDHLDSPDGGGGELFARSRQPRGLGHLMPYGDDRVQHPITVITPGPDPLVT